MFNVKELFSKGVKFQPSEQELATAEKILNAKYSEYDLENDEYVFITPDGWILGFYSPDLYDIVTTGRI